MFQDGKRLKKKKKVLSRKHVLEKAEQNRGYSGTAKANTSESLNGQSMKR